ncbi:MAG: DUF6064 family protein [Hylemonella sp.]|nr:DUF6064 family protein [Hylemonella sp.]
MSEWWTYRLSSFLMFAPKTYWRLIELHNLDVWPAHLAALVLGLALLGLAARRRAGAARVMAALLAPVWLWVGWSFHSQHYATINWAAPYYALAYAVQAVLLGLSALPRGAPAPPAGGAAPRLGWLLALSGVLLYPLAGLLAGRPWTQIELFGITPEPTALATVGLLLTARQPPGLLRGVLLIIPTLSLLVGAATLWLLVGG